MKEVTRRNLESSLQRKVPAEQLMMKNGRPEWTSAKTARRAEVAKKHRVVLILGDDINDFVRLGEISPSERRAMADHFRASWGHHWILLPNPIYGSWEKSLYEYNFKRTAKEKRQLLLAGLRTE